MARNNSGKSPALTLMRAMGCTYEIQQGQPDRRFPRIEVEAPDGKMFLTTGSVTLVCDSWTDVLCRLSSEMLVDAAD